MKNDSNKAVKWLLDIPAGKKLLVVLLMAVQAVSGCTGVLFAMFMRNIVDSAAAHETDAFYKNTVYISFLIIAQIMLRAALQSIGEYTKSEFENTFKMRLFNSILNRDLAGISAVHSGEWLNRLTNDTVVVANSMTDILPGLTGMAVRLVSAVIMMFLLDERFLLIMLPVGAVMAVFAYSLRKVMKKMHKLVQEKDGRLRIFMQESIAGLMMTRSFAAEELISEKAIDHMKEHRAARMKRNRMSNIFNSGLGLAMNGMYIFGVCYCGFGILHGTMTFGTLTAVTQLISQIQAPFAGITGYLPRFFAMTASAERLMEAEKFTADGKEALSCGDIKSIYDSMSSFGLDNASFAYYQPTKSADDLRKDPSAITDISINIRKGEYIAFTGHSGCGKSTVLKLLMCVYSPDTGSRYIITDKRYELTSEYRRLFAYVPQGNLLMSGTIRDIVTFSDKDADNEKMNRALNIACADTFVNELESKAETVLGERGMGLSEGQMQRLAIARAVYSDSPVMLLDEATSALDEKTERQVLSNLRRMTDKTVIIITHRPAAHEICDRVIDFSEIAEKGNKS